MPYDYYEYFKKQRSNKEYSETTELVRQNLWSETINFRQSQSWISIEDKILIKLYSNLRYS
jgi:chemotaxis methyl-accepting protein methylase